MNDGNTKREDFRKYIIESETLLSDEGPVQKHCIHILNLSLLHPSTAHIVHTDDVGC